MKIVLILLAVALFLGTLYFLYLNNRTPVTIGVREGKFTSCPDRPSCVSSQSQEDQHQIAPFSYKGSENPIPLLGSIIVEHFPSARIITEQQNYLHAEFRSRWFRFVDDVEFYYNPATGIVDVKSTSRVGYYDFEVNRKRVETLRTLFENR